MFDSAGVSARDEGLSVDLIDGRLVISIGVDALMVAVRSGNAWFDTFGEEQGYSIDDADGFADDIRHELEREDEGGTTLVHVAIDAAIVRALDEGSLNINYGDDA